MKTLKCVSILIILVSALFFEVLSQVKPPIAPTGPIRRAPILPPQGALSRLSDIQITDARADKSAVCPGGTISVKYTIKYAAIPYTSSTPAFVTKFYLSSDAAWSSSDTFLREVPESALPANNPRTSPWCTITIPDNDINSGNKYILVKIDANDQMKESNENNNVKSVGPIWIGSSSDWVDLLIASASVPPDPVYAGSNVNISYTITNSNSGSCGKAGVSRTKFYLSDDADYSSSDVYLGYKDEPILKPEKSNSATPPVTIPAATSAGNYYILVVCDADKQVTEKIETNNIKATNQISVIGTTEPETGTVTDIDGNVYKTIKIGSQWWMAENLKVTRYNNGIVIPLVTNNTQWASLTNGVYCNYNNDEANISTYGRLYNWYVVDDNTIAITGWKVPTDADWQILVDCLKGKEVAGGKLKETGTTHWKSPNTGATNESRFTGLPAGYRSYVDGSFATMGETTVFWSATEFNSDKAWTRTLAYNISEFLNYNDPKKCGFSIRLVKD